MTTLSTRTAFRLSLAAGLIALAFSIASVLQESAPPCGGLPKNYAPIIAFELARTQADLDAIFGTQPDTCRADMIAAMDGLEQGQFEGHAFSFIHRRYLQETELPVIPVIMVDTDTAMPIGQRIPRVMRVGVVIGEPLDFSRYEGMENDRYILRSVTDEIMIALQRLGAQRYDDVYASTVKDRLPPGAPGRP